MLFDDSNPNWRSDEALNEMFIRAHGNFFNYILTKRGSVFLNEIRDALGFERTSEGAVTGWLHGPIDFKLSSKGNGVIEILVDTEGIIYDKLPNKE